MSKLLIAQTILQQLGGNRFSAMTGAKNFVGDDTEKSLRFQLPSRGAKNGINVVTIKLNDLDMYDLSMGKMRGMKYDIVATIENVHADNLTSVFSDHTGLDTRL